MAILKDYACISVDSRDQHLPMVPKFAEPFRQKKIRGVGIHEVKVPYEIQRVSAPWHIALITISGSARYSCKGRSGLIKENTIWIGPADTSYQYKATSDWKFISAALIKSNSREHIEGSVTCKMLQNDVLHLANAVEAYLSESTHCKDGMSQEARALASYISLCIDRELGSDSENDYSRNALTLAKVWEEVNASPEASWSVSELAYKAKVSVRQFQRVMKKNYETTAEGMLTKIRMQRAQELLISTELTLDAIADRVGYSSVYSFSKAFKNYCQIPPGSFRTQNS
ncbi:helix-turn-helix transcriptional regulator [Lentisphaera marina]|uniref:helix-turn-helix domain-containing protein n=1 Tax=Lentisphaera marina TaxID=1111041 RepID=UPI00236615E0|nr:helix-turn-helix transcriptional regulator [Lentisphaera marina]MDD7987357.1 helix-turn-helix transcriptional regulator [Lentisphaera marina]